jgi:PKD repeat protein
MKKVFYPLIALLVLWACEATAQEPTNPCAGKADFQFTVNNLTVNFYSINTSNTQLSHRWHFGAGNNGSDAANPVFTYSGPGIYKVTHYIKDVTRNCYDSTIKEIRVGNICELLKPKFEWARDTAHPARIKFYNVSQPNPPPTGVLFKWTFGDGTSSTERSPVHIYQQPGEYEVCLTMTLAGTNCTKTFCARVIVPPPCYLQPAFSWSAEPANPLKVKFTNQTVLTTPNAQAKWSFGDGAGSSEWNPTHAYEKAGVYTVCLKVYISNTCVKEICKQVVVRACTIEPDFSWLMDSIYPLRGVQFKNQTLVLSTQPLRVRWSFGDGTESNEWSPFHKYEKPGTYRVCLKVAFFEDCVKEICKTIVIPEPVNCERLSNFNYRVTSEPNTIKVEAVAQHSTLKYVWTFGDGTGAFTSAAAHRYERPGKYTVCLTVYRGENCASTTCKEIIVGPIPCDLTWVKFEYERLNSVGNVIRFKAYSNQPLISQRWTIQKDNASSPVVIQANNPTYTFTQPGVYKVCLRAVTLNGCVKEYCEVIRIGEIPSTCVLTVAPNPATTQIAFRVELNGSQTITASIIDAMGVRRSVHFFNGTAGWNSFNIGIANLPTGYYSLEVKYNGRVCTTKFQKVN